MKKNKLFKTLGCLAGISAIWSIVPVVTTSCGSSNKTKIIPEDAYAINDSGVLTGWAGDWNAKRIINEGYDTMIIPKDVTEIAMGAFANSLTYNIPPINLVLDSNLVTINKFAFLNTPLVSINFSKCSKLELIDGDAFKGYKSRWSDWSNLTEVDLSSCTNLTSIGAYGFSEYYYLNSIKLPGSLTTIDTEAFRSLYDKIPRTINIVWNGLDSQPKGDGINQNAFDLGGNNRDKGTVCSTGDYPSGDLLTYLNEHCGLPSTFTAVDNY